MPEKLSNFTDPACRTYEGEDRVLWVPFAASQAWARRGGKAVDLHHRYQAATANSSNLAGWLEMDVVGVTGGHPASVSAGDELPVNFGLQKTCVFPTTNRAAVATDIGKTFDILVSGNTQYVNMTASSNNIVRLEKVLDVNGSFVSVSIPVGVRHGNL